MYHLLKTLIGSNNVDGMVSAAEVEKMITDAMRTWEKYVCITFRPKRSTDKNYVYITINGA